jgi:cytochrome P450
MFLLKDNWKSFTKSVPELGIGWQDSQQELFGSGIFGADGESWKASRKAAAHMFSASKMKSAMEEVFKRHTASLVSILREKARTGEAFDLQWLLSSFTFDTVSWTFTYIHMFIYT